jgi:hypothetical protein
VEPDHRSTPSTPQSIVAAAGRARARGRPRRGRRVQRTRRRSGAQLAEIVAVAEVDVHLSRKSPHSMLRSRGRARVLTRKLVVELLGSALDLAAVSSTWSLPCSCRRTCGPSRRERRGLLKHSRCRRPAPERISRSSWTMKVPHEDHVVARAGSRGIRGRRAFVAVPPSSIWSVSLPARTCRSGSCRSRRLKRGRLSTAVDDASRPQGLDEASAHVKGLDEHAVVAQFAGG